MVGRGACPRFQDAASLHRRLTSPRHTFAVAPVPSPPEQRSPLALAMEWVSRIFVVGLEMVLPGLGGGWLDERWGTKPLLTLVGFGLGIVCGMTHLLLMTSADTRRQKSGAQASGVERAFVVGCAAGRCGIVWSRFHLR